MKSLITGKRAFTLLCIALLLGVTVSPAAAQLNQPDWSDDMYTEFNAALLAYNENVGSSGVFDTWMLANRMVNFEVTDTDGQTATFSFETDEDLRISELRQGVRDDATLTMKTDRATMNDILDSSNPAQELKTAIKNRAITMHGHGVRGEAEILIASMIIGIANFFSGLLS